MLVGVLAGIGLPECIITWFLKFKLVSFSVAQNVEVIMVSTLIIRLSSASWLSWLERRLPKWEVPGSNQLVGGRLFLGEENLLFFPHSTQVYKWVPSTATVFSGDRLASSPGGGSPLAHHNTIETGVKQRPYRPSWLARELYLTLPLSAYTVIFLHYHICLLSDCRSCFVQILWHSLFQTYTDLGDTRFLPNWSSIQ